MHLGLHLDLPVKLSDLAISDPQEDVHTQLSAQTRYLNSFLSRFDHSHRLASNYDAPVR